jgi:hydroxyethylthiazole kinase-like uncharacterized protein yjeF
VIPVLSRAQVRALDALAVERKVPSLVLMENAGRGATDAIERALGGAEGLKASRVCIVCGGGNNGGDGFVVARHLQVRGATVETLAAADPARLTGDAKSNYDALVGLGATVSELHGDIGRLRAALGRASLVVDALFGTGLDRPTVGTFATIIESINSSGKRCVALDLPSGLDADTGATMGATVHAALTVTFAHHKLGLLTPRGARLGGRIVLADIGVPPGLVELSGHSALLVEKEDIARSLSQRPVDAHKTSAGHVAVFAGSPGHVGAAALCARAALRGGAGLVTVVTWPEVADALESGARELMTARLAREDLASSVDRILEGKRAVVIGPGFGLDDAARAVVERVLATWEGPSVVDADALSMFEERPEVFASSKGAAVLTPHPGELGRLLGLSARDIEEDRYGSIAQAVERARSVVVLKGAHTLTLAPDERTVINPTCNAALATAGSGDVLSGTIGALLCTLDPFEAAYAGVFLHGMAGDMWSESHGDRGLFAGEIADLVPLAIRALMAGHARWPV